MKELIQRIFGRIAKGDFGEEAQNILWELNQKKDRSASILMEAFEKSLSKETQIQDTMSTMEKVQRFIELEKQILKIFNSEAFWKTKYDLIFAINKEIVEIKMGFEWCDPDCDYEDDVRAYVQAIKKKVEDYNKIIK